MELTHFNICLCLLLTIVCLQFAGSWARPATELDTLDDDYYKLIGRPLPSGYYYLDNGIIRAVKKPTVNRRKDGSAGTVQFVPLVKYKHTKTKKKKLFVPNLFG